MPFGQMKDLFEWHFCFPMPRMAKFRAYATKLASLQKIIFA